MESNTIKKDGFLFFQHLGFVPVVNKFRGLKLDYLYTVVSLTDYQMHEIYYDECLNLYCSDTIISSVDQEIEKIKKGVI